MTPLHRIAPAYWLLAIAIAFGGGFAGGAAAQRGDLKLDLPNIVAPLKPENATAATYVYEQREGSVPPAVMSALNTLNRKGIVATALDADVKDGVDDVPAQYRVVFAEAKKAGLPALVVMAGDKVLKVIPNPKDEQAVIDAVSK